jgi:hypothetical protein
MSEAVIYSEGELHGQPYPAPFHPLLTDQERSRVQASFDLKRVTEMIEKQAPKVVILQNFFGAIGYYKIWVSAIDMVQAGNYLRRVDSYSADRCRSAGVPRFGSMEFLGHLALMAMDETTDFSDRNKPWAALLHFQRVPLDLLRTWDAHDMSLACKLDINGMPWETITTVLENDIDWALLSTTLEGTS